MTPQPHRSVFGRGLPPIRTCARVGAVVLALALLGVAPAQEQVSRNGTVDADVDIEIFNLIGSVRVTGWDRNEVSVQGTLGEGTERLEFRNNGDDVEIHVVVPRARRRQPDRVIGESHLEIMVPRNATLDIETATASIAVDGVAGEVSMESAVGAVTFAGDSRVIDAGSTGGDIDVATSATNAELDITGGSGNVVVQLGGGSVSAGTLTGTLRVIGGRIDEGSFESVSGDIYFEGELATGADLDFENFSGGVALMIPADTAAGFEITTYSGTIETEFGYEGQNTERFSPNQEAEFTLGAGGAEVTIEVFSGSVVIRQR